MGTQDQLFVVRDGDESLWVTVVADNRVYTYVAQLGEFVFNAGLTRDWVFDQELTYQPITAADAAATIADGTVPAVDGRRNRWLLETFRKEPDRLTLTGGLGDDMVSRELSDRVAAEAKAQQVRDAGPDEWVTYRTYPPDRRQSALQTASDIRRGKVRAFTDLPVEAAVVASEDASGHVVRVRRHGSQRRRSDEQA